MQAWTITSADGSTVLAVAFWTPSAGSHPKDNGWAWVPGEQKAWRIDAAPDISRERWTGASWAIDLGAVRAACWVEVKARRDRAEAAGCASPLGRVDTDADSQRKVSGSVQLAQIALATGQPFALPWTMQDNSTVVHDGPAMIAMGVAVGQHIAACHAAAVAKRAEIEAADSEAAIEALDIDAGWPA